MSGPYVDYACTNRYAVTLSWPVRSGDGMCGNAAAAVLVASVEKRVPPRLVAMDHPVALTNADGRVIVCSDGSLLPGQLLGLGEGGTRGAQPGSPGRVLATGRSLARLPWAGASPKRGSNSLSSVAWR